MKNIAIRFEQLYNQAKGNKWFYYFAIFCRITLALGFIPSSIVKIMGERFTGLPANNPLGHYFDALHLTGYYYTFIGITQLTAALLLLIPRTALLGALMYFPIILNIGILAYALRFEGTRIITMMLLANLYLLYWDYDRLKYCLSAILSYAYPNKVKRKPRGGSFPLLFFGCVLTTVAAVIVVNRFLYEVRPGNSQLECTNACAGSNDPEAYAVFCNCIYKQGKPLDACLERYESAKKSTR
ncbi:hypothetical protein [Parapedobacter lycopersici]|uniref:hypothetical protein n=1 Tax=Parapedobacter lycopersici TaxID=1864939 RepID=UPI00214D9688|nr:hypothetical protein [Parapedobacter lycopersici]